MICLMIKRSNWFLSTELLYLDNILWAHGWIRPLKSKKKLSILSKFLSKIICGYFLVNHAKSLGTPIFTSINI